MINHNRKIRTVRDIQTFSGKVEQVVVPYKAYMRISCLELEKYRRGKERENSIHLISKISARFQEIEAEKSALLEALNQHDCSHQPIDAGGFHAETKSMPRQNTDGFKITY